MKAPHICMYPSLWERLCALPKEHVPARVPTVSGRIYHMEVTLSRSINSSSFFLSGEGKEVQRAMKEEVSLHPWHRPVPGYNTQRLVMPAAAIPSICRRRSHLVPPRKHVPAGFSSQFSRRGLDAFQERRTATPGKVSLGRWQQPPGKGLLLLKGAHWGLWGWSHVVGQGRGGILMKWRSSIEEAQSKPPVAAETCVMAQVQHHCHQPAPQFVARTSLPCTDNSRRKDQDLHLVQWTFFALFSFQDTNNYENAATEPSDSQEGAQLAAK